MLRNNISWDTIENVLKGPDLQKLNLIIQSTTKKNPFDYEKASLFIYFISSNRKKQRYFKLCQFMHINMISKTCCHHNLYSNWISAVLLKKLHNLLLWKNCLI